MAEKEKKKGGKKNASGKSKAKKLQEQLMYTQPSIPKEDPELFEEAEAFCEGYKEFLGAGKTERECVKQAVRMLEMAGYVAYDETHTYQPGDRVYVNNRGKALIAAVIGKKKVDEGIRMNIAHVDSPRLDLKPLPLYEDSELALMKTHYYGGIRKYQWVATPLAMHGVIAKRDGTIVEIEVGEKEGDPVFCITDLLPHLAAEQKKRSLDDGIRGEELNVVVGSLPYPDAETEAAVKLGVLAILNEQFGITEKDFITAEIEMVPAGKPKDVGFDRSLIGAYAQDDRVCGYTALMAQLQCRNPEYTALCVFADKEEIGSVGHSGLASDYVFHFIEYLAQMQGVDYKKALRSTCCLSADVNAAFDPTFSFPYERRNSCFINRGTVITKYTGSRGKSGTNDADAEYFARVAACLDEADVHWQTGELGAVDDGGGGTVVMYVANHNIDVIDIGVPILSMHAPFELASKLDIYSTYQAFCAFLGMK